MKRFIAPLLFLSFGLSGCGDDPTPLDDFVVTADAAGWGATPAELEDQAEEFCDMFYGTPGDEDGVMSLWATLESELTNEDAASMRSGFQNYCYATGQNK